MRARFRRLLTGTVLAFGCSRGGSGAEGTASATQADTTAGPCDGCSSGGTTDGADTTAGESTFGESTGGTTSDDPTAGGSTGGTLGECVPAGSTGEASDGSTSTGEPPPPIDAWEDYVAAECAAFAGCGCAAPQGLGKDVAACVATRTEELAVFVAQEYTFDGACAAARLADIAAACDGTPRACEGRRCELFHATKGLLEPCTTLWGQLYPTWRDASDCGPEWSCTGGLCTALCDGTSGCAGELCVQGQTCFIDSDDYGVCFDESGVGGRCGASVGPSCAAGLVCVSDDQGVSTCQDPVGMCEPCAGACDPGLYCDARQGLCLPQRPAGARCSEHAACQSGRCTDDGCMPFHEQGESCAYVLCAPGLKCVDSVCVIGGQLGDPCAGPTCVSGLACTAAGSCERPICIEL